MKEIAVLLLATLSLVGCAMDSAAKARVTSVDYMQDNIIVYGAFAIEPVEPITWFGNGSCSKSAFLLYVRKEKNLDRVMDLIMKETCTEPDPGTYEKRCGCEYSGIGMKYRQIDASEAALWRAASGGSASAAGVDPE